MVPINKNRVFLPLDKYLEENEATLDKIAMISMWEDNKIVSTYTKGYKGADAVKEGYLDKDLSKYIVIDEYFDHMGWDIEIEEISKRAIKKDSWVTKILSNKIVRKIFKNK